MRIAPKPLPGQEVRLEDLLKQKPKSEHPASPMKHVEIKLNAWDSGGDAVISGVELHDGTHTIEVMRHLLRFDPSLDYFGWSKVQEENENYRAASSEEVFGILSALYYSILTGPSPAGREVLEGIKKSWREAGTLYTLSQVSYLSPGDIFEVEVKHRAGLKTTFSGVWDLHDGEEDFINDPSTCAETACGAILGCADLDLVGRVWSDYTAHIPKLIRMRPHSTGNYVPVILDVESINLTGTRKEPTDSIFLLGIRTKEIKEATP